MGKWIIKAMVQKCVSVLPKSSQLNYFFQKYITRNVELTPEVFEEKLAQCRKHLENYRSFSNHKRSNFKALELGTGRYPIIPLGLFLCGCEEMWTVDVVPLILKQTLKTSLEFFLDYAKIKTLWELLPLASPDRINHLQNTLKALEIAGPYKALEESCIHAIITKSSEIHPFCSSFDLVVSNNTFEHIPQRNLLNWLKEFRKVTSDNGVMSHFVDMRDHYWYFQKDLSMLNFLKYSDRKWKLFCNSLLYQNRLMTSDYTRLHNTAGFEVIRMQCKKANPGNLDGMKIDHQFSKYPREELETLECWIVSRILNKRRSTV